MGWIIDGLGLLAALVVAAMAVAISSEVVLRSLGYRPYGWTLEMSEYGLLVIGFLAAPWVLRHGDHIRVDVILRSASDPWLNRLLIFANLLAAFTCIVLSVYGTQAALEAFQRGSLLFKHIKMPQWIILSMMPLGTALLAYEFLARTLRRLAGARIAGEGTGGPAL